MRAMGKKNGRIRQREGKPAKGARGWVNKEAFWGIEQGVLCS